MNKEKIKEITDNATSLCLIGIRAFDHDVQQYTCKFINGEKCKCYMDYKKALENALVMDDTSTSEVSANG